MDILEDVPILHDTLIPLASSVGPKENGQYENDAGVHDHEYDNCNDFNVDEGCIVEETLIEESCEKIEHEVPPPCLELVEYMSLDAFNLIPTSLPYSRSSSSPMHEFMRPLTSFVNNAINVDLGLMDNLFDIFQGESV